MSKVMETTSLSALLHRIAGEYRAKASIFEIPEAGFRPIFALEAESPGLEVMGKRVSIPLGPAAGPHTQIAPNLVAAWLAGSRVFELKTVQVMDRLEIEKPCILALDEGHNTEWSTELSLDEAREEYLRAWIAINLLAELWSPRPRDFFFNMSIGYTLEGIRGERVDAFIEGLRNPASGGYWKVALGELESFVASPHFARAFGASARAKVTALLSRFPAAPLHSVTLSTMHGCPPAEIEAIGSYLMEKKGFDTYVKLNPTLLGYDEARSILDATEWKGVGLKRHTFEADLQFDDALGLVSRLGELAEVQGRRFGIKLSNTLANENDGARLPGAERYMSGRALFPLTIRLAARLAGALPDFPRRFSYCGGVSALNAGELVAAGLGPLTVATDILKPGGYLRLSDMARAVVGALTEQARSGNSTAKGGGAPGSPTVPILLRGEGRPDSKRLARIASEALVRPEYRQGWKSHDAYIEGPLPLFDCFAAPCIEACPVNQKVPEYIRLVADGRPAESLAMILADNPLPCITGTLCDHVCQAACSRNDYEGSVAIRAVKLAAANAASIPVEGDSRSPNAKQAAGILPRVAVIGAGPAGLAAAHYLAQAGVPVTVFDRDGEAGGVVSNVVPSFRIPREAIEKDLARIKKLGAEFRMGSGVKDGAALRKEGFTSIIVASGAPVARELRLEGEGLRVVDALAFLAATARGDGDFAGVQSVLVAGGGNTAMDAVRRASRIKGVQSVAISYRRSRRDMPAEREEVEAAIAEAFAVGTKKPLIDMSLPERVRPGHVLLRTMKAGDKDASGRRAPVPSEETMELECDLLIAAIGEMPDADFLAGFGIGVGKDGRPQVDRDTGAAGTADIYVAGDARRGPASIIGAEADGRAAAKTILEGAGIHPAVTRYTPPPAVPADLARRGDLAESLPVTDPGFLVREAARCLACDSACHRCVEVCPNRAYFIVPVAPGSKSAQILHLDALCNECGNCGSFCPWDGEPWNGKPTLFSDAKALSSSSNAGFALVTEKGTEGAPTWRLHFRASPRGEIRQLPFESWFAQAEPLGKNPDTGEDADRMVALARQVLRDHPYLVGGPR
jgi:putative selenate reductase